MPRCLMVLCTMLVLTTTMSTDAAEHDWLPHFWKRSCPPTHSERLNRAGDPFCISKWAKCPGPYNYGYYVGGGARKGGDVRCWHEGTWGLDYNHPGTVTHLGWWHGRRFQSGDGQYEPDEKNNGKVPRVAP